MTGRKRSKTWCGDRQSCEERVDSRGRDARARGVPTAGKVAAVEGAARKALTGRSHGADGRVGARAFRRARFRSVNSRAGYC